MPLDKELEAEEWRTLQLGPFDTCYQMALEMGYRVSDLIPSRGLRLHIPSTHAWATITVLNPAWELVVYNYRPRDDDKRLKL